MFPICLRSGSRGSVTSAWGAKKKSKTKQYISAFLKVKFSGQTWRTRVLVQSPKTETSASGLFGLRLASLLIIRNLWPDHFQTMKKTEQNICTKADTHVRFVIYFTLRRPGEEKHICLVSPSSGRKEGSDINNKRGQLFGLCVTVYGVSKTVKGVLGGLCTWVAHNAALHYKFHHHPSQGKKKKKLWSQLRTEWVLQLYLVHGNTFPTQQMWHNRKGLSRVFFFWATGANNCHFSLGPQPLGRLCLVSNL